MVGSMQGKPRSWGVRACALVLLATMNALLGPALLGGPTAANAVEPCGPEIGRAHV